MQILFMPFCKVCLSFTMLVSTKPMLAQEHFVKNFCIKFKENPIVYSFIWMDRQGLHIRHSFYFVLNMLEVICTQVLK
jgi:hypothetical protein